MLLAALFLATVNKGIVDYLAKPIKQKWPDADLWWLTYVALVTGGVIGWASEANLFIELIPDLTAGRVLTAVLVGCGASLIHDLFEGAVGFLNKPPIQVRYDVSSPTTATDRAIKEQVLEQVVEKK